MKVSCYSFTSQTYLEIKDTLQHDCHCTSARLFVLFWPN